MVRSKLTSLKERKKTHRVTLDIEDVCEILPHFENHENILILLSGLDGKDNRAKKLKLNKKMQLKHVKCSEQTLNKF